MVDGTPQLATSFLESPVVSRGEYQYFIHPLTDGVPRVDPSLLSEVVDRMVELADMDCDVILAPEAMGIPLATALSIRTGIPFSVIRKRRYDLEGEIELHQRTGYSDSYLYINGGLESGGFYLAAGGGGIFYEIGFNDVKKLVRAWRSNDPCVR